jgi:hypothetical protein
MGGTRRPARLRFERTDAAVPEHGRLRRVGVRRSSTGRGGDPRPAQSATDPFRDRAGTNPAARVEVRVRAADGTAAPAGGCNAAQYHDGDPHPWVYLP